MEKVFNEDSDYTGEVALAMAEFRREFGNCVTVFDGGEDARFDVSKCGVKLPEIN